MTIKVFVASDNPVKISGVYKAFAEMFDTNDVEVIHADIQTTLSFQPLNKQVQLSACERLINAEQYCARSNIDVIDYIVGAESGLVMVDKHYYCVTWVCIRRRCQGGVKDSIGSSAQYRVPPAAAVRACEGEEFGPVMDELLGMSNGKQGEGGISKLSNGKIKREDEIREATRHALIPLLNLDLYFS